MRLKGEPTGTGGVQVCPAAGGAKHWPEPNTPGATCVSVKSSSGRASATMKSVTMTSVPGTMPTMSWMVPNVPPMPTNDPVPVRNWMSPIGVLKMSGNSPKFT